MNEDPIIAEIRRYRAEHAEKYGHDLGRICEALREAETKSGRKVVHRKPHLLLPKTGRKFWSSGNSILNSSVDS